MSTYKARKSGNGILRHFPLDGPSRTEPANQPTHVLVPRSFELGGIEVYRILVFGTTADNVRRTWILACSECSNLDRECRSHLYLYLALILAVRHLQTVARYHAIMLVNAYMSSAADTPAVYVV